jgi:WS/DGAT/MGAT family acyltransferase
LPTTYYERLSAMDAMFLELEDESAHMHMGSVAIVDAKPLRRDDGSLDIDRLLAFMHVQIGKIPRFRQKLARIRGFEHPVWVDDARFNPIYHLRHTALPHGAGERELKRLVGRILSQKLDRGKPLWEFWFVEGLEEGRLGVVSKIHHCVADGIASGDLLRAVMGPKLDYEPGPVKEWVPREAPAAAWMMVDELVHRVTGPLRSLGVGATAGSSQESPREPSPDALSVVREALRGALKTAERGFYRASPTPLNVEIGPHRRFDWTQLDLGEMKELGHRAGGTLNDAVLAVVTCAVRSFLEQRGVALDGLEFRVAVPVNVRTEAEQHELGNRVSTMLVSLPVDEPDPWKRLLRVVETTKALKSSTESRTIGWLAGLADWLPAGVMSAVSRFGSRSHVVNMVVTNVPGPSVPLYLLGTRMLAAYPVVPLLPGQALGVAILSYEGKLFWGFNSDWEALHDLHDFVEMVQAGFETLAKAAASR